jgi:4-amino-4-deoxy-L-arabinose transferase-like glycosyltransferase
MRVGNASKAITVIALFVLRIAMRSWIKLLPLLAYLLLAVGVLSADTLRYDEIFYVALAKSLTHGHFNAQPPEPDLWRGPGYPIVLAPFVTLDLPYRVPKLLNALFLFGAACFFYATLRSYVSERSALLAAYLLGVYPSLLAEGNRLFTEPFATFLIAGFGFALCAALRKRGWHWLLLGLAAFFLGYLALTRVFFGYVIVVLLLTVAVLFLWRRQVAYAKTLVVCVLALLLCTPWLYYTYRQTGQVFYWGTSGGMQLYWMATPYSGEYGDWLSPDTVMQNDLLSQHHGELFTRISQMSGVEADTALKQQAVQNIRRYPAKYVLNLAANISRLFFSFPYTNTPESLKPVPRMFPNTVVLLLALLAVYPGWINRRQVPCEVHLVLGFGLLALGGSALLSAYERQFHPLVPTFALWITYVLAQFVRLQVIRCSPSAQPSSPVDNRSST